MAEGDILERDVQDDMMEGGSRESVVQDSTAGGDVVDGIAAEGEEMILQLQRYTGPESVNAAKVDQAGNYRRKRHSKKHKSSHSNKK